ncbi:hypothetical protein C900_05235 [Fulvivirga imtechensis AK7]|uniref:Uncharacterized protein n=1 Tax=Fulvivirga imtechensis AK7 TaxID=1237149 RepID=L8JVW3_9BACT|nr:hypothetical protein C900_05235 [Fulvivirga imtechensis AK7]
MFQTGRVCDLSSQALKFSHLLTALTFFVIPKALKLSG